MKIAVKILYVTLTVFFLFYLALETSPFPNPPNDVYQSGEPADVESYYRRGYYTDLTRGEVLSYYKNIYGTNILGYKLPTYRLNYPPEESQTIIRDQTRSTFLEEIVQPFRESVFVNGFEPSLDKDKIIINGYHWKEKIIVKQFPSNRILRVIVGFVSMILVYFVAINLTQSTSSIYEILNKKK